MRFATYVYAIVGERDGSAGFAQTPPGLPSAGPTRLLSVAGSLKLVVASVPLACYAQPIVEKRLTDLRWLARIAPAHERLVEHFARAQPTLPMKLFTLFRSDHDAVASVAPRRRHWQSLLRRVTGRR